MSEQTIFEQIKLQMTQEASAVGLLRAILTIIAIYYVLKYAARIFGPMLMRYAARKVERKFTEHFDQQNDTQPNQQEKKEVKTNTDNIGEYIDFEEIDE